MVIGTLCLIIKLLKKLKDCNPSLLSKILGMLINKFVETQSEVMRVLIFKLVYHSLRLLAWADGKENNIVSEFLSESYSTYLGLILSLIQTNPKTYMRIKKYSMKILAVLVRDYANFTKQSLTSILEPCWKYINLHLPIYIEVACNGRKIEEENVYESYYNSISIGINSIELLNILINKSLIKTALQVGLKQTLSILLSYLSLEKLEEDGELDENYEYVMINEEEYVHKLRGKCLQVMKQLIDLYGDYCLSTLIGCIKTILTTQPTPHNFANFDFEMIDMLSFSYETNAKDFYWKKCEGILLLLGHISEDIIFYSKKAKDKLLEKIYTVLLSAPVSKYFNNHKPLLGRLLWSLSMVSEYLITIPDLARKALALAINSIINENKISIKLSALLLIVRYSSFIEWRNDKAKESIMAVSQNINVIIHTVNSSLLSYPLEALKIFATESCDLLIKGCSQIYATILNLIDDCAGEEIDDPKLLDVLIIFAKTCKKQFISLFWDKFKNIVNKYITDDKKRSPYSLKLVTDTMHTLIECYTQINTTKLIDFISHSIMSTEDSLLLNSMTWLLRALTFKHSKEILTNSLSQHILDTCKYLFRPTILENSLLHLGYLIIITFNKLIPSVDTEILFEVIKKVYKARMPSIVQSLVLIFAKLIVLHPHEILSFLTDTSHESRISLKILLDKWLLHQPLFRGKLTVSTTIYALTKLFERKDQRIETLRVITYNPSHSNMNSEVNAPFKILCTLLRYVDNETTKRIVSPEDILGEGKEENYGGQMQTIISPNKSDEKIKNGEGNDAPIKVKWEDLKNEEDYQVQLLDIEKNFDIKESWDKGLADVETGSTCYMSEMLAFDFDECAENDDMEEDDIGSLEDLQVPENILEYTIKFLTGICKSDSKYLEMCSKHLLEADRSLLKKYILSS